MQTQQIAIAMLLAAFFAPLQAKAVRVSLTWAELDEAIKGRNVEMVLPDATSIQGQVRSVTADTLEIEIRKTSDGKAHPKGATSLPRSSVKTLQYTEIRGKWRALGTAIGAGAAGAAGGLAATRFNNEGNSTGAATALAGSVGAGVASGYFLGRSADRQVTTIQVVD